MFYVVCYKGIQSVLPMRSGVSNTALPVVSVTVVFVTVASVLLHAGAIFWWMTRPVQVQPIPGAQTVAVELISAASPVSEPVVTAPAQPVPPTPVAPVPPEPEALPDDEIALQYKVPKKKPAEKKLPAKPQSSAEEQPVTSAATTLSAATAVAAPATAPAPIIAARYDADYLKNPPPLYPSMSRRLSEEGRVLLRVQVSQTGNVQAIELKQSSGFARLDEAARNAVTQWRFSPARQGDTALVSWVEVPIQFSLQK